MLIAKEQNEKIRVVVADDNQDIREKVLQLLRPKFDVIGTAGDGRSACEAVLLLSPEVVVLDISMPGGNGIETALELRKKGSKTKTVFLTVHADPDFVRAAMKAGASAYVVKSHMATDLMSAMTSAIDGKFFISPSVSLAE